MTDSAAWYKTPTFASACICICLHTHPFSDDTSPPPPPPSNPPSYSPYLLVPLLLVAVMLAYEQPFGTPVSRVPVSLPPPWTIIYIYIYRGVCVCGHAPRAQTKPPHTNHTDPFPHPHITSQLPSGHPKGGDPSKCPFAAMLGLSAAQQPGDEQAKAGKAS